MARIKYGGTEPAAPPADSYWLPGEERDIDDDDVVERLLRNPIFTQVKQTKAPPKGGTAPETEQTEQAAPAEAAAPAEGS